MCDLRGNPTICRDNNSLIMDLPFYKGGTWRGDTEIKGFGIYHIGASGCGYYHYDGNSFLRLDDIGVWQNKKYQYGVKSGEVNLFGEEAVRYNEVIYRDKWLTDFGKVITYE